MTPVQIDWLGPILDGRDLVAQAETGSGKTAAFAIGILNKLNINMFKTQALVICPTRELSDQVAAEIRRLATTLSNTRVVTLCGGKPMHDQLTSLSREPHIVVGTPGRLIAHLNKGTLRLENVATLVLDEADRMFDMGFFDDITRIIDATEDDKQTLLFSATYPDEILGISKAVQNEPVKVTVKPSATTANINQHFVFAKEEHKVDSLLRALGKYQPDNAIIFCNRKQTVQDLCEVLQAKGFHAKALHGDMEQRDRDEAIIVFTNNSANLLVATDVAARGLDITALSAVINYDFALTPDTHIHRIGRTGRAGLEGTALSLVNPDETHRVRALEDYAKMEITFGELRASDITNEPPTAPTTSTILLNAGKKDKIRPGDIVGVLTAHPEISQEDIGKIKVQAKISFVAVNKNKAGLALKVLTEEKVKRTKTRPRMLK
jgi:ATP-independent RNA helicase DbpA